ncbi:hypothetical protein BHM03_00053833 [Ensete ventricosum]|nr:hypothetical protein BHM03_00053833 [Ensete ventricosum]
MPALDVGLEHGIVGVVNGAVLGDPHLDRAPYHEVVDGVRIVLDQCCWIFVEPEDSARRGSACMRIINLVGCGARGKLEVVAGSVMPRWSRIPSLVQWINTFDWESRRPFADTELVLLLHRGGRLFRGRCVAHMISYKARSPKHHDELSHFLGR